MQTEEINLKYDEKAAHYFLSDKGIHCFPSHWIAMYRHIRRYSATIE
jgi:hypothetical protein